MTAQENQSFLICASIQVVHGLIIVNMSALIFTYLQAKGLSMASSVAIAALMGPAQVAARLIELANKEYKKANYEASRELRIIEG